MLKVNDKKARRMLLRCFNEFHICCSGVFVVNSEEAWTIWYVRKISEKLYFLSPW